jgi:Ca2+-binding EF-hand superfamily protein
VTSIEQRKKSILKVNDKDRSNYHHLLVLVFIELETDQLKFPDYVSAVLSIPTTVTDKDIIPAFQVFDVDKRGVLEADELLKSLATVGEMLDELEATTFRDNIKINEVGLFDYNGK